MSWEVIPQIECVITDVPTGTYGIGQASSPYGFLDQPPICWTVTANEINEESQQNMQGRYMTPTGNIQGQSTPVLQDTYIYGSAGRTGIAFDINQGTASDNWINPQITGHYGIQWGSSLLGSTFEATQHTQDTQIDPCQIQFSMGYNPVGDNLPTANSLNFPFTGSAVYYTYCYINFAFDPTNSGTDYRLAFDWGYPVRLDYFDGTEWNLGVAVLKNAGNSEWFLRARNNVVTINVQPTEYVETNTYVRPAIFAVEVGYGNWLRHSPTVFDSSANGGRGAFVPAQLPQLGNVHIIGQNGWAGFQYFPYNQGPLQAQSPIRDFGQIDNNTWLNANAAYVVANGLIEPPTDDEGNEQSIQYSINTDGQRFQYVVQGVGPDADDNYQSAFSPQFSDGTLVIPANWTTGVPGYANGGIYGNYPPLLNVGPSGNSSYIFLPVVKLEELQVFDDASRTYTSSATVTSTNYYGNFYGAMQNFAVSLSTGNSVNYPDYPTMPSQTVFQRITGVGGVGEEGNVLIAEGGGTTRLWQMPVSDKSYLMQGSPSNPQTLQQEVIFDGWCLFAAVQYLAEVSNINPYFVQNSYDPNTGIVTPGGIWPYGVYYPPLINQIGTPFGKPPVIGGSPTPYGPAGADCPYAILPEGTGLSPKYRFLPDDNPWLMLQRIAQDSGDVALSGGFSLPYYYGFDAFGFLKFFPFNPLGTPTQLTPLPMAYPTMCAIVDNPLLWSANTSIPAVPILDIRVYNSTAQMRSSVTVQGVDAFTNQLTQIRIEQSPYVKEAIGYRIDALQRNARWATDIYSQEVALAEAAVSSLPNVTVVTMTPYLPFLFAGNVVVVYNQYSLGGSMYGVVLRHRSALGMNSVEGTSGHVDGWSFLTIRWLQDYLVTP